MVRGTPFIILENPVWGKDEGTYTWAYNGLNGLGYIPDSSGPRDHPVLDEWREWKSRSITIFGQTVHDKALRGADIEQWARSVKQVIPEAEFRKHPIMVDSNHEFQEAYEDCLKRTSLAITYNSTVGAQCVIRGIPTIAMHAGSLAWPVSTHELTETPVTPDRTEWIRQLAWRHISDDVPTEYILSGFEEAREQAQRGEYDNMSNGRPQ